MPSLPEVVLADTLPADAEVLVIGLETTDDGPRALVGDRLSAEAAEQLLDRLVAVGATGKAEESTRIPAPAELGVTSVLAVGLGDPAKRDADQLRRAAGAAARALTGVDVAAATLGSIDLAAAVEGFALGGYEFVEFRATSRPEPAGRRVGRVVLLAEPTPANEAIRDRAYRVAEAVATARDWINTPPNHLYPATFADQAAAAGRELGLDVEVLDEQALADGGYGGIVGVGQGSARPPRLVRLSYAGGGPDAPKIALIGKGITFDTGGISIKPAAGMELMTMDMGGAAAVLATICYAARQQLPLTVVATVPMAENMPSGTAQRPGDVLTQYGGTKVEVLNTDAEGRLILADAIVRAGEDAPAYLIDVATLTGAQMIALGTRTPGVMGTDEFRDRVARISQQIGENGWAMPLPAELRTDLNSRIADLANVTNHRYGGMLSAGLFLREFVPDDVHWVHLDIAGPAYNNGAPWGYTAKGGTGVPVRTLIAVLEDIAAEG
ncbi:leucyl aminopeptidase [Skermania piniformis]|uniref:Probable cytosol aminopeptidase n=1 Tax=Skermania pinensis TaxID=39122 RepID=A0ABX8SC65_9ACTN|nr:leucyl aminopeptidase [Skermania piniformis]QXQ15041.1 leucyl aminopeptidase [Skermania piniformis]